MMATSAVLSKVTRIDYHGGTVRGSNDDWLVAWDFYECVLVRSSTLFSFPFHSFVSMTGGCSPAFWT